MPRITWGVAHLLLLLIAGALYSNAGSDWWGAWFGYLQGGDATRRLVLWLVGFLFWLRMVLAGLYILRRRFGWDEFWPVLFACTVYQLGFAAVGTVRPEPLGTLDALGIGLFLLGSFLNTCSELQRKRFKDQPQNQGKLYTGGLFRRVRHVNYLGDSLWALGWAVLTANLWSLIVPLLLTAGFIFYFIPTLSRHLRSKYGGSYDDWLRKSWALIPLVY